MIKAYKLIKRIATVILYIFAGGFILCWNWKEVINDLHNKAHAENKNSVWFSKRCITTYLATVFLSLLNIYVWILSFYLILK